MNRIERWTDAQWNRGLKTLQIILHIGEAAPIAIGTAG
jgi:hypothetical protein